MAQLIRQITIGMPTKWMPQPPTPAAVRIHCVCGEETWSERDTVMNNPPGTVVVEEVFQCAACLTPAEFMAACVNSQMLGYRRR